MTGIVAVLVALAGCTRDNGKHAKLRVEPAVCSQEPGADAFTFTDGRGPRNVLMLSIDTLRRDMLGRYGGDGMPFLDGLAARGVALDDHMQCSNWTYHSTSCTLLGAHPEDLGFMPRLKKRFAVPWPAEPEFLAETLSAAGYQTVLYSSNGWLSPEYANDQGYAVSVKTGGTLTSLLARGLDKLDPSADQPWFLHVHTTEPHAPYAPPSEYLGGLAGLEPAPWDLSVKDEHYDLLFGNAPDDLDRDLLEDHLRVRYAGEVQWVDDQLEAAFETLEGGGFLDDTLVVVWTDHGEQFWEHGRQTHAHFLHGEENDGIAVFWSQNLLPCAWSGPTLATDLVPTILHLLELPVPAHVSGQVVGTAPADRTRLALAVARQGGVQVVRRGNLKMHYTWSDGALEVFERDADPGERTDLYNPADAASDELWQILEPRAAAAHELAGDVDFRLP